MENPNEVKGWLEHTNRVINSPLINVKARVLLENAAQWFKRYQDDKGGLSSPKWWQWKKRRHLVSLALEFMAEAKNWEDANKG